MKVIFCLLPFLVACSRSPQEVTTTQPSPAPSQTAAPEPPDAPWNPNGIDWQPFEKGMAQAKKENKLACLVLYTTWCPHCKNYSHIFADPRLVMRSRAFVMIRVDADANEEVSQRYRPDGTYVPRTFILNGDGTMDPRGRSDHPRYAHFFDENHADSLLEAMDDALSK